MSDPKANIDITARDLATAVFKNVEGNVRGIERTARVASKAFQLLAVGFSVRELGQVVTRYESIDARLRTLSRTTSDYNRVQDELRAFADRTGSSYAVVVQRYQEASIAARRAGDDQEAAARKALIALEDQANTTGEVSKAATRLANSFGSLFARMAEGTGITNALAAAMNGLAKSFEQPSNAKALEVNLTGLTQSIEFLRKEIELGEAAQKGNWLQRLLVDDDQIEGFKRQLDEVSAKIRAMVQERNDQLQEIVVKQKRIDPRIFEATREFDLGAIANRRKPVFDTLPDFDAAGRERAEQQREQLERNLEVVRQFTLTEDQVEREATQRRLEIVRSAFEQKLIDQQRYSDLSAEIAKKGAAVQLRIVQDEVFRERQLRAQQLDQVAGLFDGINAITAVGANESKKAFEINKKVSTANAIVSTLAGVARAFADHAFPASAIIAASVAALGFAQVKQIRSTSWQGEGSGSGGIGGGGGVSGTPPSATDRLPILNPSRERGQVRVELHDVHFYGPGGADQFGRLVRDIISRDVNDRDVIIVNRNSAQAREIRGGS